MLVQGLSQAEAARRLGIAKDTLANWVVAAKGGQEKSAPGGRSFAGREAEVARLRKALAQANMERDIIKKPPRTLLRSHCQVRVDSMTAGFYPVSIIYSVLEASRAGFYHWRQRPLSPRRQEDERLKVAIRAAHGKTRQTYGAVQQKRPPAGLIHQTGVVSTALRLTGRSRCNLAC